jgi:hypothetical protein
MRYNAPNSIEYADAGSRAIKNRVRDVHQTYNVCTNKKHAQIKILLSDAAQFESVGTYAGLSL